MDNDHDSTPHDESLSLSEDDRREFLRRARRFAITAPATVLLLEIATGTASPYGATTTTHHPGPSDRRLKTDIVQEGTLPNGIGLYSFRFKWARQRFMGVMADEVEAAMPAAVSVHRTGFKMVDYGMVLG